MGQFLGPEADRMCQFLGPETDIMGERYFMPANSIKSFIHVPYIVYFFLVNIVVNNGFNDIV